MEGSALTEKSSILPRLAERDIYHGTINGVKAQRRAKLFQNGRSQALRLPVEFRFPGKEVYIWKDETTGNVILSARPDSRNFWNEYFKRPRDPADAEAADFLAERDTSLPEERELF